MNLKNFLKKAQKEKWAIGQFNFSNLEILKAAVFTAKKMNSPIILGISEGEAKFFGLKEAVAIVKILRKIWPPIFLNLDHGKSFGIIKDALDVGYDCVHFDGSELTLKENIKNTREVVKYAKKKGVLVEGEVGIIAKAGEEGILTDSSDVLNFIKEAEVNSLAVSIGNVHGIDFSGENPHLDLKRLREISEKLKNKVFLVLHGGSGTPKEDLKKAIKLGVVKINISTELRLAYTNTLKKVLSEKPNEIRPYKYLPKVIEAAQKVVEEKILLFGSDKKRY